jgi:hypothetical protein
VVCLIHLEFFLSISDDNSYRRVGDLLRKAEPAKAMTSIISQVFGAQLNKGAQPVRWCSSLALESSSLTAMQSVVAWSMEALMFCNL